MLETQGSIDTIEFTDEEVHIEGWITTAGGPPVEAIRVKSGPRLMPGVVAELKLPSLDVWKVHPGLVEADRCRFHLRVPAAKADHAAIRTTPLTVIPVFEGREGGMLARLVDSPLPPPVPYDVALVGGGAGVLDVSCTLYTYFVELGGLTPGHDVLDIGCGFGRVAHSLVNYLEPPARYEGFDVVPHMIDWASENITSRHPNFQFRRVDLYNKTYNPEGKLLSSAFRFPYEDASFDFAYLISVFTHMFGLDIRHYLDEIARVLRPGGRCLATCFLLNDESRDLIARGKNPAPVHSLKHKIEDGFTYDLEYPEQAIGFDEPRFLGWITERGLKVRSVHHGVWCGRTNTTYYQDVVILEK